MNRWSIARLPQVENEQQQQQQQQQQQDDDDDEEEEEEEEEIKGDEYSTPQRLKFMPSPESIRTVALPPSATKSAGQQINVSIIIGRTERERERERERAQIHAHSAPPPSRLGPFFFSKKNNKPKRQPSTETMGERKKTIKSQ